METNPKYTSKSKVVFDDSETNTDYHELLKFHLSQVSLERQKKYEEEMSDEQPHKDDVIMASFLLILTRLQAFFGVSIVDFEQVNTDWDLP